MMHQPDCPLFNQEGEGRKRTQTLARLITDQLPRTKKQIENEKNALKISDDKVISSINQHLSEAKKKPEKKEKKKPEKKSQKEREVKVQEQEEVSEEENIEEKKELEKLQEDIDDEDEEGISSADYETKMNSYLAKPMDDFKKWLQQLSSVALLTNKDIPVPTRTSYNRHDPVPVLGLRFVNEVQK